MNLDEVKNYTFIKLIRLIKLACATVFMINKRKKNCSHFQLNRTLLVAFILLKIIFLMKRNKKQWNKNSE